MPVISNPGKDASLCIGKVFGCIPQLFTVWFCRKMFQISMTVNEGWQFWCIQSFLLWSSCGLCYWWLYKLKMLVYLEDCTILIISMCFLQCEISLLTVDCLSIVGMEPVEFHSVTRVGSGYSMFELTELIQKLSPHWQQVIPGHCPPGLVWTKEKPDVWIAPQNSYILEV
jgi:hypothetical protein